LAEFERAIIIERTSAGLKAAKARGASSGEFMSSQGN
jgi:DNA invertase Pin-like site-specific DNA recombinase